MKWLGINYDKPHPLPDRVQVQEPTKEHYTGELRGLINELGLAIGRIEKRLDGIEPKQDSLAGSLTALSEQMSGGFDGLAIVMREILTQEKEQYESKILLIGILFDEQGKKLDKLLAKKPRKKGKGRK